MACIANVTRVNVPTSGPKVSSIVMTTTTTRLDHSPLGNHRPAVEDDCGGGNTASVKKSFPTTVQSSSRPNGTTPAILRIPSRKDMAVDRPAASSTMKNPGMIGNNTLSVSKSSWKKRGRSSEHLMQSHESYHKSSMNALNDLSKKPSNSFTKRTEISKNDDPVGFSSNVSNVQEQIDLQNTSSSEDKTEIELTKEQIDNVIDTTLPANFSFRLPLALTPKNNNDKNHNNNGNNTNKKMRDESQDYDSFPRNKKPRQHSPPLTTVVITKMMDRESAQPHDDDDDDDDEATATPSQSSMGHPAKIPTSGRWTREEHEAFLEGLEIYGREWKKVAQRIPTRTSAQIRSHAQKYFAKLSRDEQSRTSLVNVQQQEEGEERHVLVVHPDHREGGGGEMQEKVVEYPPSVLDRMEKILRDPLGAEIEVAQTLKRLRERYSELHAKLQQQENNQVDIIHQKNRFSPSGTAAQGQNQRNLDRSTTQSDVFSPIDTTHSNPKVNTKAYNQSFAPVQTPPAITKSSHQSRPCIRICNESLALHSKELIALSVLGGELYRSSSYQDLSKAATNSSLESPNHAPLPPTATTSATSLQPKDGSKPGSGRRLSHPTSVNPPIHTSLGGNKSSDTDSDE